MKIDISSPGLYLGNIPKLSRHSCVYYKTTLKQTKSGRVRGSIFSRIFNIYTMFIKVCSCLYRGNNSKVHNIVTPDDLWHLATPFFEREKTEKLFINFVHQIILVIAILKKKRWFALRNYFKICYILQILHTSFILQISELSMKLEDKYSNKMSTVKKKYTLVWISVLYFKISYNRPCDHMQASSTDVIKRNLPFNN